MSGSELTIKSAEAETWVLASWLFLRLLGLIYLSAFVSLGTQIKGLIGREGILPAEEFLHGHRHWGPRRFFRLPTLCWLSASDVALHCLCWGGAGLAVLLIIGFAPVSVLMLLWVYYLSLMTVGRIFLGYQWDLLLLEAGFLAIFLAPWEFFSRFPPATSPPIVILWLFWWLLFRLMFSSGVMKLYHGDFFWRKLTALSHHYETQPLPTRPAWMAHQLPRWCHKASAVVMFGIELVAPFLIVAPAPWRHAAAALFLMFMVLIQLTGNYGFFNLLGMALAVLLLDDQIIGPVFLRFCDLASPLPFHSAPLVARWMAVGLVVPILTLSLQNLASQFWARPNWPGFVARWLDLLEPFRLANRYGLFSVMTKTRPEIIIEGSDDGVNWREYEFKWKPGDVRRAPRFIAPHQPRLDWQMWFAAQEPATKRSWLDQFLARLEAGSPAVLSLLRRNPFPQGPPRHVRAVLYDYRFTSRPEPHTTSTWWRRVRLAHPSTQTSQPNRREAGGVTSCRGNS